MGPLQNVDVGGAAVHFNRYYVVRILNYVKLRMHQCFIEVENECLAAPTVFWELPNQTLSNRVLLPADEQVLALPVLLFLLGTQTVCLTLPLLVGCLCMMVLL